MKKILLIPLFLILFITCEKTTETEEDETTETNEIIFTPINFYGSPVDPFVEVEYCTLNTGGNTFYERIWVRHNAGYSLSATSTIVLQGLDIYWESVDSETEPASSYLYWEYSNDYGSGTDFTYNPVTITYGTSFEFKIKESFVGHLSAGGNNPPETEQDSLYRIRIHNILDFYSTPVLPFELRTGGYFLLSTSDSSHFQVSYLDTFEIIVDTTVCY